MPAENALQLLGAPARGVKRREFFDGSDAEDAQAVSLVRPAKKRGSSRRKKERRIAKAAQAFSAPEPAPPRPVLTPEDEKVDEPTEEEELDMVSGDEQMHEPIVEQEESGPASEDDVPTLDFSHPPTPEPELEEDAESPMPPPTPASPSTVREVPSPVREVPAAAAATEEFNPNSYRFSLTTDEIDLRNEFVLFLHGKVQRLLGRQGRSRVLIQHIGDQVDRLQLRLELEALCRALGQ
ncbi:hypothetical protein C8A00DRAFT_38210 [Chaetomidium leptoderma]|uniref:Uncharacterized protein n=1 Tax=Chaetomidium leptoderma TaxID=669021 RepID=A0AAN6VDR5_9PEZI|nr:hypothetical protein C8A00DRAFT_38210 [Chaetomidium leptoderma]